MMPTIGLSAYSVRQRFGNIGRGERDGRDEKPELDDEGNDVAEVAVLDVQRREEKTQAQRQADGKQHEQRQHQKLPAGSDPVPQHQDDEQAQGDEKVDEGRRHGSTGNDQARKIDLGDQVGVTDQAAGGFRERGGEKLPGKDGGKHEDRLRQSAGA